MPGAQGMYRKLVCSESRRMSQGEKEMPLGPTEASSRCPPTLDFFPLLWPLTRQELAHMGYRFLQLWKNQIRGHVLSPT